MNALEKTNLTNNNSIKMTKKKSKSRKGQQQQHQQQQQQQNSQQKHEDEEEKHSNFVEQKSDINKKLHNNKEEMTSNNSLNMISEKLEHNLEYKENGCCMENHLTDENDKSQNSDHHNNHNHNNKNDIDDDGSNVVDDGNVKNQREISSKISNENITRSITKNTRSIGGAPAPSSEKKIIENMPSSEKNHSNFIGNGEIENNLLKSAKKSKSKISSSSTLPIKKNSIMKNHNSINCSNDKNSMTSENDVTEKLNKLVIIDEKPENVSQLEVSKDQQQNEHHTVFSSTSCKGDDNHQIGEDKELNEDKCISVPKEMTTTSAVTVNGLDRNTIIEYKEYESELQMQDIMRLIQSELSEPYSIYTYRYFIYNWPKLCFLAAHGNEYVGAIVCKLDMHMNVKRGYIAMLAVKKEYRKMKIGTNLVQKAIEAMLADDADEVVLETEMKNIPALRLYENLGFVRDKRLFRYYLNGVDALRLKLWFR